MEHISAEKYIAGKRFIHFTMEEMICELTGQRNIKQLIQKIIARKKGYFGEAITHETMKELQAALREKGEKDLLRASEVAKTAIEDTLISLQSGDRLEDSKVKLGEYMRDRLKMNSSEFKLFLDLS